MSQIDKLIKKLQSNPKDFTFDELRRIMNYFEYREDNGGKSSGSKVRFVGKDGSAFDMHKRHPGNELLPYQIRGVVDHLKERDLI